MTELLERAVSTARALPPHLQDAIAEFVLDLAEDEAASVSLSPAELASFAVSLEQAERGEFATDEEVAAIWAKYGL